MSDDLTISFELLRISAAVEDAARWLEMAKQAIGKMALALAEAEAGIANLKAARLPQHVATVVPLKRA